MTKMEKILSKIKLYYHLLQRKWRQTLVFDKYILSQMLEFFILGIVVFTSLIFASTAFTQTIKEAAGAGIPTYMALMMIVLNLPYVFVSSIPISTLLAAIMTVNKLSTNSEIAIFKSCGIGVERLSKPIMFFAIVAAFAGVFINEFIVPTTSMQSKQLAIYALQQKHVPEGKTNYTLKETKGGTSLKRLLYVQKCKDKKLNNITIVDMSKDDVVQIIQAKEGGADREGWIFNNGVIYTLSKGEKTLNTALFENSVVNFGLENITKLARENTNQYNFIKLAMFLHKNRNNPDFDDKTRMEYKVQLWDKIALPLSAIPLALVGIPLGVTPPRIRYNRGLLFSIAIIFIYFVIRAVCVSLGESKIIAAFWAAWLPVIALSIIGYLLFRQKAYKI